MLTLSSVSKSYGDHSILNQISLTFEPGMIYGIVGENGAGKTTLFKCIAGLETFGGRVEYSGGILKNLTGYLPTVPFYFSHMTGYEYLQLLSRARGKSIPESAGFNLFDLPLNQYAETYSTGMQKKLAITGMLLQKNEVFILDEPFNGVDISSNLQILDMLKKLKQHRKTILLSSHVFSSLEDSCDILHYLKNGEIVASCGKGNFSEIESAMKREAKPNTLIDTIYGDDEFKVFPSE